MPEVSYMTPIIRRVCHARATGRGFTKDNHRLSRKMDKAQVLPQDAITKDEMTGTAVPDDPATIPKKRNACSVFSTHLSKAFNTDSNLSLGTYVYQA